MKTRSATIVTCIGSAQAARTYQPDTGMPNFGSLFTLEETWLLVDYLRLLAFGAGESTVPE